MIKKFVKEKKLNEDSLMAAETLPLIKSITDRLSQAKLRADATLLSIFANLQLALEELSPQKDGEDSGYDTTKLVNEILNETYSVQV